MRAGGSANPLQKTKSGWLVSNRGTRQRWYKVYLDRELAKMEAKRGKGDEISYTTGQDELCSACPDVCRMFFLIPCIVLSCICPDPKPKGGYGFEDDDAPKAGCCSCCNCCGCCDCCACCRGIEKPTRY